VSKIEQRTISKELRATQGDKPSLVGYAALFNSPSKDLGGFTEVISPGAFTRALVSEQQVSCLYNHDGNRILGTTKNGTLKLSTDSKGLRFECRVNANDPEAMAIHARVVRGDADACSFAFLVVPGGESWTGNQRVLTDVDLHDVSVLSVSPAYEGTSVNARAEVREHATKLARVLAMPGDWKRRERAAQIAQHIAKDGK